MTNNTTLKGPCEARIEFIERSAPTDLGDIAPKCQEICRLSIIGWQIMALKSASENGIRVDPETIRRVDTFHDSQKSDYGSFYGYRGTQREVCTTAIGLLLRLYRGWSNTNLSLHHGADYIVGLGSSIDGVYYNYDATHLLFLMEHEK